jgi:hypothetical protein
LLSAVQQMLRPSIPGDFSLQIRYLV